MEYEKAFVPKLEVLQISSIKMVVNGKLCFLVIYLPVVEIYTDG